MPRSAYGRFGLPALVWLVTACGGDDAAACPPTDPSCAPQASALQVAGVAPADGAKHVDASTPVVVTFSRPVQPGSVTPTSVTVGSAPGTLTVSGATVTFRPTGTLALGSDYQVRVQGVRDLEGTGMAAPFTSGFTVRTAPVCTECPATAFARDDVEAEGKVVQTAEGFTVEGSLSLRTGDSRRVTFLGADLELRFDPAGRLRSISGKAQIPSPHERITFAEPVRADVGIFPGSYLNEHRDLGILLKNDTDYIVYDFETALRMSIATGETGAGATTPVVVRSPTGRRTLMVVDYRDPMYYVYGEVEAIGAAAGVGWSLNGRIPFVPRNTVAGLGAFDGRSTRTGTFPFKKVFSVTGQIVDNRETEVHLSLEDPFASSLGAAYQAGFNGSVALDLFLKDIVGLEIPLADASGGIRGEASTQAGFSGYAFARGMTSSDLSWWPAFIPARPATGLDVQARVESTGGFQVSLAGQYGWDFPSGQQSMSGRFELTDKAMTLAGAIRDGAVELNLTGVVTAASTSVFIQPPPALLQQLHGTVNDRVLTEVAGAQKAWNDLQKATEDYQFEVSLRGIRTLLPGIVDVTKASITAGIASALKDHEGWFYYDELKGVVDSHAKPYRDRLDALKAAALKGDDAATRSALKAVLLAVAANKFFTFSYTHFIGPDCCRIKVWGPVEFSRRILSDAQAAQLVLAAGYVDNIPAKSSIMISMRQIYDQIPTREIFEQVRDDLKDGLLVMEDIGELGFVLPHTAPVAFNVYAVIGGRRYEVGSIQALTVAALAARLTDAMIAALRTN